MARGKNFTKSEDDLIQLMLARGSTVIEVAEYLGRGRTAIYKRLDVIKGQKVFDLGQLND